MRANHDPTWVTIQTGKGDIDVHVEPGQFIFGRDSAARELRMKSSSVRNRMEKLKNMQNLDIQADSQYSIITIANWDTYQPRKDEIGQPKGQPEDRQRTGKGQAKDTEKNDKNVKNEKEVSIKPAKDKSNGKVKLAEYVLMKPSELQSLVKKYGQPRADRMVEVLNNYIGANPKKRKYESHYHAINSWVAGKVLEEIPIKEENDDGWQLT